MLRDARYYICRRSVATSGNFCAAMMVPVLSGVSPRVSHVPGVGSPLLAPHGRGAFARLRLGILPGFPVSLRQMVDGDRELPYRLNPSTTPVVKGCRKQPRKLNCPDADACLRTYCATIKCDDCDPHRDTPAAVITLDDPRLVPRCHRMCRRSGLTLTF